MGIPTVEERRRQRAVARIVSAIYEPDCRACSCGYRPGRNPHMALKALRDHIVTGKVRHVYEADIQGYFTHLNHEWLRKMIALRIADPVITGLIGKWLKAGVMEHGVIARPEAGTPQGGPITLPTKLQTCRERSREASRGCSYAPGMVTGCEVPRSRTGASSDRSPRGGEEAVMARRAPRPPTALQVRVTFEPHRGTADWVAHASAHLVPWPRRPVARTAPATPPAAEHPQPVGSRNAA